MSVNRNRRKMSKAHNSREYRIILMTILFPIYWDEGKEYKGRLESYQQRRCRTWKYNRKTQYKNE